MNVFVEVKDRVTMAAVLQHFGLKTDRRGNILCPFHADHKPSCKIYENSFYCWACGAGGDVINFTARYLNIPNKGAAEYLAGTFGIITDAPETLRQQAERQKREQEHRKQKEWEAWKAYAFKVLTTYQALLWAGRRSNDTDNLWWVKCHQKDCIIEYYLDCLEENPEEFYKIYRQEVKRIETAIAGRQHQGRRTVG